LPGNPFFFTSDPDRGARDPGDDALDSAVMTASYRLRRRAGPRPGTTTTNPHTQLTQNAPEDLQERVLAFAQALPGVVVGPSLVSVQGARAFLLPQAPPGEAFMIGHEFAHLHPADDGSLHLTLAPEDVAAAIENGWAERHPMAGRFGLTVNLVMVYGPRDEDELAVVTDLLRASHGNAAAGD
jgi:phospholipase/carboxylesterase